MPLSTHYGLALVSVLMLPSSGLVDVAPAANCTAPACADLETSSLLQMRGDGPMGHLSEADTSSTLLTEGMDLKKSAIIVIDLQNDFVHPNGTLSNAGAHIGVIEPVNKLLRLDWGVRIFTADNHPANHVSFSKNHQSESFIPNGAFPLVDLQYSSLVGTPTAKICGPDYMSTYGEAGQICNGFPTPSGEAYSPDISVPQETYPAHCVQSTWGQKIYEEVNFSHSRLSDMYVLKGENAHIDSYSAIFNNLACNATLRYNHSNAGWQPQPPPAAGPAGEARRGSLEAAEEAAAAAEGGGPQEAAEEAAAAAEGGGPQEADAGAAGRAPGPCRLWNRGRCRRGAGCRSAHICSQCWRAGAGRLPHAACEGVCQGSSEQVPSVQETVEAALRKTYADCAELGALLQAPPSGLVSSGRTDRGVHARQLLAYCNCHVRGCPDESLLQAAARALPGALGERLPEDVRCRGAEWAGVEFRARGEGRKTYAYYIIEAGAAGAGALGRVPEAAWLLHEAGPRLDAAAMREAASALEGRHDFLLLSSVPAPSENSSGGGGNTIRHVFSVEVSSPVVHEHFELLGYCFAGGVGVESGHCLACAANSEVDAPAGEPEAAAEQGARLTVVRVCGHGFLRHMVRRIAGLLVEVGLGRLPPDLARELLQPAGDAARPQRPPKAPARGLWLERVEPAVA